MSNYSTNYLDKIVSNPTLSNPPILDMHSRFSKQDMGYRGEGYALELLHKSGYIAAKCPVSDFEVTNPATAETLKLEVKTAQRRPDGKYVFQIWNPGTDYRHSDILLLLAIQKSGYPVPFVIPTDAFDFRSTICITSHPQSYKGMWSEYRQSLHQITLERTRQ